MSTIEKALAKAETRLDEVGQVDPCEVASETAVSNVAEERSPPRMRTALTHDTAEIQSGGATKGRYQRLALDQLRRFGMLTPDAKRSQLAEEYRLIKRPLLTNIDMKGADVVENANLIMVTSALAGEGKTFSAINLAMSIAMERDRTVLLVDGDVAKPTAAMRLGIQADAGLIDLLAGARLTIRDVLVRTDVPNMRVIPAGTRHERATELLASERMSAVMDEISSRYRDRVVIFDSPPLLLSSESAVLAEMMGQIVVVVAAEQTPQHAVADALSRLGKDKIVGLLLNRFRPSLGNRFGTAYGYGYGYGDGQEPSGVDAEPQQAG